MQHTIHKYRLVLVFAEKNNLKRFCFIILQQKKIIYFESLFALDLFYSYFEFTHAYSW